MPTKGFILAIALSLLTSLCFGNTSFAASFKGWEIQGSNEIRWDYYHVSGDKTQSSYQETGSFLSDRLNLNMSKELKPGKHVDFHVETLVADDAYLADEGIALEWLHLQLEDASTNIPYRIEIGDIYANVSSRTLQRTIRGATVDLQSQSPTKSQSLLLLSGTGETRWEETFDKKGDDLYFNSASYLLSTQSTQKKTIGFNIVHAHQSAAAEAFLFPVTSQDQYIGSIIGQADLGKITVEGEYAYALQSISSASNTSGTGGYLQISNDSRHFSNRLRFEKNDADFIPLGGIGVISNRNAVEFHSKFRPKFGGTFNLRVQHFQDNVDGPFARVDTKAFSTRYKGRLKKWRPRLKYVLSAEAQTIEAKDLTTDISFNRYEFILKDTFKHGFYGRYRINYTDSKDTAARFSPKKRINNIFSIGRRFKGKLFDEEVKYNIRLALKNRHQYENAGFFFYRPLIGFSARSKHHNLRLRYFMKLQDTDRATANDFSNHSRKASYTYRRGRHSISLEWSEFLRSPRGELKTDTNRTHVIYRLEF